MNTRYTKSFLSLFLTIFFLQACQPNSDQQTTAKTSPPNLTNQQESSLQKQDLAVFSTHLISEEISALRDLLYQFEKGLLKEYKTGDLTQAYQLLALGLRKELLDEGNPMGLYPFKGGFDLAVFEEKAAQLSFMTNACGFQKADQKVINYYCLKDNSKLIDFYQNDSSSNSFITFFLNSYQDSKTISPELRQSLLMQPYDQIDFTDPSEKTFYALCLLLVKAEIQAYQESIK